MADIMTWTELIIWSIPLILVIIIVMVFIKMRKFPIEAIIIERRGENLIITNDRLGNYRDKYTGLNGYQMLKLKDRIPIVNYSWIMHTNKRPITLLDRLSNKLAPIQGTIFLFKYGSRQYKPLNVKDNKKGEKEFQELIGVTDENGNPVYNEVYQQFDPRGAIQGLDFEVMDWDDFNFLVQEFKSSFERRRKEKDWLKQIVIPAMTIGGAVVASIVMIKYAYDLSALLPKTCPAPGVTNNSTSTPSNTNPNIPFISDVLPN